MLTTHLLGGVALLVVGVFFVVLGVQRTLAKGKLENVQLAFDSDEVRAGTPVKWRASYKPKPNTKINHATVTFKCREIVISGSGKHRTIYEALRHQSEQVLPLNADPSFDGIFEAPHLYSMALTDHQLRWTVTFRIDIAWFPDYFVETEFVVLPPCKKLTDSAPSTATDVW